MTAGELFQSACIKYKHMYNTGVNEGICISAKKLFTLKQGNKSCLFLRLYFSKHLDPICVS